MIMLLVFGGLLEKQAGTLATDELIRNLRPKRAYQPDFGSQILCKKKDEPFCFVNKTLAVDSTGW